MNKAKLKTYSLGLIKERIEYYMDLILYHLDAMSKGGTYRDILIAKNKIKSLKVRLKRAITVFLETEYEDDHYDSYKGNHVEWLNEKLLKLGQHSDEFLHRFVRNIIDPSLTFECECTFSYGNQVVHIKV